MKFFKFFVIALLLSIIFSVSAVCAIDENSTLDESNINDDSIETLSVSSQKHEIDSVGKEDNLLNSIDENQLGENNHASFADIRAMVNGANDGDEIYLDGKTYIGDGSDIRIQYKNLTIYGGTKANPHMYATLDAQNLSRILSISTDYYRNCTVVLDSIIFTNCTGAVYAKANLNINNCYFTNSNNTNDPALDFSSENYIDGGNGYYNYTVYHLNVVDSFFINNHVTSQYEGGAVSIWHSIAYDPISYNYISSIKTFVNCVFKDNSATRGGAIYVHGQGNMVNCTFINNTAQFGGAIWCLHDVNITDSKFINNSANEGGAVYGTGNDLNISGSEFISNHAVHGGAIYDAGGWTTIVDNDFINNTAEDSSNAIYITHSGSSKVDLTLKGNKVHSNISEIYFDYGVDQLNIVVLDNRTVKFCEGKIKLYAYVSDDEGNKFSADNFTFLIGTKEIVTKLVDSYAEIEYDATLADNAKVVGVKNPKYSRNNIYTGILEIIPFSKEIHFEDATGIMGRNIQVPIRVCDASGHPLEGKIRIIYNGNDFSLPLIGGRKNLTISLPNEVCVFDLTVEYEDISLTRKVNVVEPPAVIPVIEVALNETGFAGKTLSIPVKVHDDAGNPLRGDITVSYNGQEKTLTLINGEVEVLIGLPVYETFFEVGISYNGKSAICRVNVVDHAIETKANVDLPDVTRGNVNDNVVIPISVKDDDGNPLKGNVSLYYMGKHETKTLTNGETSLVISLPNYETSFEVVVDYRGNIATCLVEVTDPVNHTDVIISVNQKESGNVGKSISIPVSIKNSKGEALTGDIHVAYLGVDKTITLVNGGAELVIALPLVESTFDLVISYKSHSAICSVEVIDPKPHLTVPVIVMPGNKTYQTGRTILIPVEVHDRDGNPLEGDIVVYYNSKEYAQTLINGTSNVIISSQPDEVEFEVTVAYNGYMAHCLVKVVDNKPVEPSVVITMPSSQSGHVGHTIIVPVSVSDSEGNALEGEIMVLYDSHERTQALQNGHANVIMELPANPTSFNLTVEYNGKSAKCLISVLQQGSEVPTNDTELVIELEENITGNVGKTILVPVGVHDGEGNALGGDIFVIYNGHGRKVSLRDGVANVLIGLPIHASTFELTVIYDEIFKTTTVHAVDPNNVLGNLTEAEVGKDGSIVIDFPKDAKGDVVVNIGGKNYTAKIVDGKVQLDVKDLPNGNYQSSVYYSGDGNYSGFTRSIMIVVKESTAGNNQQNTPVKPPVAVKKASKITAKKKTFKKSVKVKKYSITLKSGKTPLKKVQVTIKVGKKTYKAKTNAKGKATFKINKLTKKGKYIGVIKYNGDKAYKASTKKVKITVK